MLVWCSGLPRVATIFPALSLSVPLHRRRSGFSLLPSRSAAKLNDFAAIAFRWSAFRQRREILHRFSLVRQFLPQFTAGLRLAIKPLGNRSRTTHFTQQQNLHLKVAAFGCHSQQVADADLTRRLGRLPVRLDPAEFASTFCQRTRLEKSGGPEPYIDSYAGHNRSSSIRAQCFVRYGPSRV